MSSELENCLTKAISEFKVRDMLTKFGLPEDAEVTLEMQLDDHPKPIASCPVPNTIKKDHIRCGTLSLNSFQNLVIDEFITPAINNLNLSRYIPDDDRFVNGESKMKIIFHSNSHSSSMNLVISSFCCCKFPDGKCCCMCLG